MFGSRLDDKFTDEEGSVLTSELSMSCLLNEKMDYSASRSPFYCCATGIRVTKASAVIYEGRLYSRDMILAQESHGEFVVKIDGQETPRITGERVFPYALLRGLLTHLETASTLAITEQNLEALYICPLTLEFPLSKAVLVNKSGKTYAKSELFDAMRLNPVDPSNRAPLAPDHDVVVDPIHLRLLQAINYAQQHRNTPIKAAGNKPFAFPDIGDSVITIDSTNPVTLDLLAVFENWQPPEPEAIDVAKEIYFKEPGRFSLYGIINRLFGTKLRYSIFSKSEYPLLRLLPFLNAVALAMLFFPLLLQGVGFFASGSLVLPIAMTLTLPFIQFFYNAWAKSLTEDVYRWLTSSNQNPQAQTLLFNQLAPNLSQFRNRRGRVASLGVMFFVLCSSGYIDVFYALTWPQLAFLGSAYVALCYMLYCSITTFVLMVSSLSGGYQFLNGLEHIGSKFVDYLMTPFKNPSDTLLASMTSGLFFYALNLAMVASVITGMAFVAYFASVYLGMSSIGIALNLSGGLLPLTYPGILRTAKQIQHLLFPHSLPHTEVVDPIDGNFALRILMGIIIAGCFVAVSSPPIAVAFGMLFFTISAEIHNPLSSKAPIRVPVSHQRYKYPSVVLHQAIQANHFSPVNKYTPDTQPNLAANQAQGVAAALEEKRDRLVSSSAAVIPSLSVGQVFAPKPAVLGAPALLFKNQTTPCPDREEKPAFY